MKGGGDAKFIWTRFIFDLLVGAERWLLLPGRKTLDLNVRDVSGLDRLDESYARREENKFLAHLTGIEITAKDFIF